jgi:hypothetical protein
MGGCHLVPCSVWIGLSRDFPFGFWPTTGASLFRDFLSAPQVFKFFFQSFANPAPVFFGERSASLTFVPFHTTFPLRFLGFLGVLL